MKNINFVLVILFFFTNVYYSLFTLLFRETAGEMSGSIFSYMSAFSTVAVCYLAIILNVASKPKIPIIWTTIAFSVYISLCGLAYLNSIPLFDVAKCLAFPTNAFAIFLAVYFLALDGNWASQRMDKVFNLLLVDFVVVFILMWLQNQAQWYVRPVMETYMFFLGLPFVLLFKNPLMRNSGIILFGVLIVLSGKRGGLLAYGAMVFAYFFVKNVFIEKRNKVLYIITMPISFAIIGFIVILFAGDHLTSILYRFQDLSEDGGSGRLDVYLYILEYLKNEPLLYNIFGIGYHDVVMILSTTFTSSGGAGGILAAHNDYLQFLWGYGAIGFAFILSILFMFIRKAVALVSARSYYAPAFCSALVAYFFFMNYSVLHFFTGYNVMLFSFFGYVYARTATPAIERMNMLRGRY